MHGESLRRMSILQGCRHKSDVSCASQASPKPNITAGQSIIAWTLLALRLAGLIPTPQNERPNPEMTASVLDLGTILLLYILWRSKRDETLFISRHSLWLRQFKDFASRRFERSSPPLEDDMSVITTSFASAGVDPCVD